jgi:hypothetical protein
MTRSVGVRYACLCCGYLTLSRRGSCEVCRVCYWQDDGQSDHDADVVRGTMNRDLSLTRARANFRRFGASHPLDVEFVRPPYADEQSVSC